MRDHCDIRHRAADASSILSKAFVESNGSQQAFGGLKTLAEKRRAEKLYGRR